MPANRSTVQREFSKARVADPKPITGRESARELLQTAFPAYVGRQERIAFELMQRSIDENCAVFMTLSGAMTPAGLHQSCILPMIERGLVSCLTTTGANLYHDAHRVIGHALREINPNAGDLQLRLARIIRIYDLGFYEEVLFDTDRLFSAIVQKPAFQRKMTTAEFHYLLGKEMAALEKALKVEVPSLLATCFKHAVPIFVGAIQDGSIFLNVVKLKRLLGDRFKFEIDINEDVFAMAAVQHYCRHHGSKRMAVWMLGGGVPKNYTLQGEPLLDQILNVRTDGFDIDVQFCVDPVDNGALSSCPASEGHTWGKVSAECVATSSMYVHADVTAVFPWLAHALLSDKAVKRAPLRLMDYLEDAISYLDKDVEKQRKPLEETLYFEGINAPTRRR
ncbi:MAG TPA: deoxyhypusine synthase family protein [Myxococcales bacterium]|jgi:deoxyhypusine synthase